jgi:hydroxyacylglutathione hydrolase/adenylyltransferase/sulfurtransferase
MGTFDAPEMTISPHRAAELLADGADFIDVRETYERDAGYIPGTRHIELERLSSQSGTIDPLKPVVFQCRLGARSAMAAQAFRGAGYDAYTLDGGIIAWVNAGMAIEPDGGYVADH